MVHERSSMRALERVAAPALFALALALRVREALRAPLWFDELYTRAAVDRPWDAMWRVVRADVHPPLFYLLARLDRIFGDSDLAVRAPSLVFALLALIAGWRLARELFGPGTALVATLLVALHPWHVYLSQEARSYPLLWFALTAAWLGAWRWCERGARGDGALYVVGAAVAVWTHYLALVLLAAPALWGAIALAREPGRLGRLGGWVLLNLLVAACFAPIAPLAWAQLHRLEGSHWLLPPGPAELLDTWRRFAFGSVRVLAPAALLALVPLLDRRARRPASLLLAVGPLAVLLCWALGARGLRVFAYKYMLFAVAPFLTLVAAGALRLPGRLLRAAVVVALAAFAAHALALQPPYPEAGSFGDVRTRLVGRTKSGDVMFHADAHTWLFGEHYYPEMRHRLLPMGQALPYWDGRAVVPDTSLGTAAELRRAVGTRWWALAWGRGALRADAFGALADSFAVAPAESCGLVRLWSGTALH